MTNNQIQQKLLKRTRKSVGIDDIFKKCKIQPRTVYQTQNHISYNQKKSVLSNC